VNSIAIPSPAAKRLAEAAGDCKITLEFKRDAYTTDDGWLNPGLSVIVDPDGKIVAGPPEKQEGILYADVERAQLVGPRWQLDIAGHYTRPDLFELRIRREKRSLRATDATLSIDRSR